MLKQFAVLSSCSVLALTLAACDAGSGASGSSSAAATGKPGATTSATATAGATAKPAEDKLTEYDLSSAGDKWKGYVAKLPREGAKVMGDGADGARLATNGREENPFDIAWAPGTGHLPDVKKGLEDSLKQGNLKREFLADGTPGIEYVNTYDGGTKSYHFHILMKVGGADFYCYTLPMGLADEAQFNKHKAACKTLAKK